MSRSGYSEDMDDWWAHIRWRGQVASATRGKRGQKLLRDLRDALEAMPVKRLIVNKLEAGGEVCALGALGRARGMDMRQIDPDEREQVAAAFDIAEPLAAEVVYLNDEWWDHVTPEERWSRMHAWVVRQIRPEP